MTVGAWALFCLTETLLCLSPGPSALLVISLGLTRGRGAAGSATGGVLAANAIYFVLSASGLTALHGVSAEAFRAIQMLGAAYLVWLGLRVIARSFAATEGTTPAVPRLVAKPPDARELQRAFRQGFVTQGANPNLLVYFSAILPQFVDTHSALAPQIALLAGSSIAIEGMVLSAYAALASGAGRRAAPRVRTWAQRVGGGLLVTAGMRLAALRRAA